MTRQPQSAETSRDDAQHEPKGGASPTPDAGVGPALVEAQWQGPFGWPGFEVQSGLMTIPRTSGVYLQTFEYGDGFLIYAAGITRRPFRTRFVEHTRCYMNGDYNVLDLAAVRQGVRSEIWHGWHYARAHREEFEARREEIVKAVRRQLCGFRVFVVALGNAPRLLERVESAVMQHLWAQEPPVSSIPDRGMQLAGRWRTEEPIILRNRCKVHLHGLPEELEI